MKIQSLYHTYKRYYTLQTGRITALPIVILMPHSACNCRCVMCDIWKGNQHQKQLTEKDITGLLTTLEKLGTKQVLMSGGEALLHPNFFWFCEIIRRQKIKISVLSTGLTLKKNAAQLVKWADDIIVSLDGDEALHDNIRNIPGAYHKLKEGIKAIKAIDPGFSITGRTVIHRLNYRQWPAIIDAAKDLGLNRISFLPADVSSNAFNRETAWDNNRQDEILIPGNELDALQAIINTIATEYKTDFLTGFIAESVLKIQKIHSHYAAFYNQLAFPVKKCNAPWVSAVIEADGNVRPCFFHHAYGNIREESLDKIINSESAVAFRRNLDVGRDATCRKCVCYLNLSPGSVPG